MHLRCTFILIISKRKISIHKNMLGKVNALLRITFSHASIINDLILCFYNASIYDKVKSRMKLMHLTKL